MGKHLLMILLLLLFHHYNVPNLCSRLFPVFVLDLTPRKLSIEICLVLWPGHNIFFLAGLFGELTPELGNPMVFNLW